MHWALTAVLPAAFIAFSPNFHPQRPRLSVCTACALRAHCVHSAHAEARILTQEYHSSVQ